MQRRAALATAAAAGFSVLAVGAALGANLRTEAEPPADPVASVSEATPTTLGPTVRTVIVPAPGGAPTASSPAATGVIPATVTDDRGSDWDDDRDDDWDDDDGDRHDDDHDHDD